MLNNFFMIVGGQKCGTTSLHNWLSQHPDICMSIPKEPKFFEIDYWRGSKWYEDNCYFHNCKLDMKFYGEARVQNILVKYVPDRIKEYDPLTKIVIMVRNPIDRFISAWNHFKVMRPGREIRTLDQAVDEGIENFDLDCFDSEEKFYANLDPKGGPYGGRYLEHGCYYPLMQRYWYQFETHIIVMEDLINSPILVYSRLLKFLGAKSFVPDFKILNHKEYTHNGDVARKILHNFYIGGVYDLSDFMQRDLNKLWDIHDD